MTWAVEAQDLGWGEKKAKLFCRCQHERKKEEKKRE
jgi:hypothetical protein